MNNQIQKDKIRKARRAVRVRKNLHGTATKPRLSVIKTNKHVTAQLIDDDKGMTLASVSTLSKEGGLKKNKESAKKLGATLAEKAIACNVREVVFDRGASKYHGILAEFADAARAGGLTF